MFLQRHRIVTPGHKYASSYAYEILLNVSHGQYHRHQIHIKLYICNYEYIFYFYFICLSKSYAILFHIKLLLSLILLNCYPFFDLHYNYNMTNRRLNS